MLTAAQNIDAMLATSNDPSELEVDLSKEIARNVLSGSNTVNMLTGRFLTNVSLRKLKYKDHDRKAMIVGMILHWLENES